MSSMPPLQSTPSPPAPEQFRPLSVGELFDRAFSIYFRHVVVFASLLFVVVVPIAIVQYFMTHNLLDAYMEIINSALQHSTTPPDLSKLINDAPAAQAWTGVYYLLAFFALPLANAAVVSGVSRAYLGLPVRFRACYQDAFSRWGYVLLLTLLWVAVLVALSIALVFVFIFVIAITAGLTALFKVAGAIITGIMLVLLFLALTFFIIMGYMAAASSFIACVLEKIDPVQSFIAGIRRIFGGGLFWRSVGVAGGLFLVGIAFVLVLSVLGVIAVWLTKSMFLYIAVTQLGNVFWLALAFVVVALYYYDIRIRREGFDIQMLAQQLERSSAVATTTASPTPKSP